MITQSEIDSLLVPHIDRGGAAARVCFDTVLFYDMPRARLGSGLARACELFVASAAGSLAWYKTHTMKAAVAAKSDAITMVRSVVSSPDFAKPGNVGLTLHSGPEARDFRAPALSFFSVERKDERGKPIHRTFLRLCLAPTPGQAEGRRLFQMATQSAAAVPVSCGYAGYSWFWDRGDTRLERALGERKGLLLSHPAMGYHDPSVFHPFVGNGLIQVGWLTFVAAAMMKRVGDHRLTANKAVAVSSLGDQGDAVFVAGEAPVIGSLDPARSVELDPYRAIGRALAPLRLPDPLLEFLDLAGFDDEETARDWYLRFFGEESD